MLIELVVGAMVVAVLVAVAIPAFRGFHQSAQDRAAQTEIGDVLLSERAFRVEEGRYTDEAAELAPFQPNAVIDESNPEAGVTITLGAKAAVVCIERVSDSGSAFGVWDGAGEAAFYGRGGGLTDACPDQPPAGYSPEGW